MKKLAFTIQVFGLISALPLYVITELNKVKVPSNSLEKSIELTKAWEATLTMVSSDTTAAFESHYMAVKKPKNIIIKQIN